MYYSSKSLKSNLLILHKKTGAQKKMSGFEFFNKWLEWNGIIGWTGSILSVIQMAYGIDLTEYPFDEPIKRTLEEI